MGAINLDTCDAVEHRIFSVDLDEEGEDGCGRLRIPTKSITDSDGNRSPVPTETDHLSEPATRDLES